MNPCRLNNPQELHVVANVFMSLLDYILTGSAKIRMKEGELNDRMDLYGLWEIDIFPECRPRNKRNSMYQLQKIGIAGNS